MGLSLVYFAPHPDRDVHAEIVSLLNRIHRTLGMPWREVRVSYLGSARGISERAAYETYLRPNCRSIQKCLHILGEFKVDVLIESTARKFRSRRGNYRVAGSVALAYEGRVICALSYRHEILSFLNLLLTQGPALLKAIVEEVGNTSRRRAGEAADTIPERTVLRKYAATLARWGYEVYTNVKHNINSGEDPEYMFQPDADIIAIKHNYIIGLEVKGGGREGPTLNKVYTGLGEAIFYLINPILLTYRGRNLRGGALDKAYLVLPTLPPRISRDTTLRIFRTVGLVGLITLDEGVLIEPKRNPFINPVKKEALLRNKHVLQRYLTYRPT